jgi:hypothetical protein
MIGFLINGLVQTAVSNTRIKEFLVADELDQNAIEMMEEEEEEGEEERKEGKPTEITGKKMEGII